MEKKPKCSCTGGRRWAHRAVEDVSTAPPWEENEEEGGGETREAGRARTWSSRSKAPQAIYGLAGFASRARVRVTFERPLPSGALRHPIHTDDSHRSSSEHGPEPRTHL